MNIGLVTAGILSLTFSAFAQQTATIPVPGTSTIIQGDLYGHGTRGVILAHGGGRNRQSWHKQAEALSEAGFVVLAIDYRGDTISDKGTTNFVGAYEDNTADVLGAAAYLRAHGAQSIYGVGASMGGSALAEADAQSKPGEFERIVNTSFLRRRGRRPDREKALYRGARRCQRIRPPPPRHPEFVCQGARTERVDPPRRLGSRTSHFRYRPGPATDERDPPLFHRALTGPWNVTLLLAGYFARTITLPAFGIE